MPNPTASDLHINAPLSNVSVAYMQSADAYIADKVFPPVGVQKKSDVYWRYSKSDWRRTNVKRRAPGTEVPLVGWNQETDSYFCHTYAVGKDIDDEDRANADANFNLDRDATEFLTNQHLIQRDLDWAAAYFQTGIWSTQYQGVESGAGSGAGGVPGSGQFLAWDDASSDPISNVTNWDIKFRQLTGFKYNICVMGAYVMGALKNHPDILDRIKYTQRGVVTEDLVATLFDVDELYVSYATITNGPQIDDAAAQDAAATYSFISNATAVGFFYAPPAPSLLTPSAGYTFYWRGFIGGQGKGIRVKKYRMEHLSSDRVEAQQSYTMKVVAPDCGIFCYNVVQVPA